MYKRFLFGHVVFWGLMAIALAGLTGCNVFGRGSRVDSSDSGRMLSGGDEAPLSEASREELLRGAVAAHVAQASRVDSPGEAPLVRRDPYFLKEYSRYPRGAADKQVRMRETESRVAPLAADVTLPKQRFATAMHRRRDAALEDAHFFRETGEETLTYQWRNGRWVQVASMFIVEVKEERVNGEWQAVEPVLEEEYYLREPRRGFFGRVFGGVFGR